jgi:Tfp pilus assembly protein PilX
MKRAMRHHQQGVTLVVALIMLVMLTMLALTSANLGNSSLQSVSNMQQRSDVYAAAQETVEQALSKQFYENPTAMITDPVCGANAKCIDYNGDGTADVRVTLSQPVCVKAQPYIPPDLSDMQEVTCAQEQDQSSLSMDRKVVNSSCFDTVWEIQAQAKDTVTNATVNYVQGLAVPVAEKDVPATCMPS